MELEKNKMWLDCLAKDYIKMRTVDEDLNVPDAKCDIGRIICSSYDAVVETKKNSDMKEHVRIALVFDVLYLGSDNAGLEHMEGRLAIEEMFETGSSGDLINTKISVTMDDFNVRIVNSRKINVKALLKISCHIDEINEEEIIVNVSGDNIYKKQERVAYSRLKANGEETYRIREEITLPKNKPNIKRLIWKNVRIKSRETRLLDGQIYIKGELGVFIIYNAYENEIAHCYETAVMFEGKLDADGVDEDMFAFIPMKLQEISISVKPDYDGEDRVLSLEGIIGLDVSIYCEEEADVLLDMYSVKSDMEISDTVKKYNQIAMKNVVKCRGYGKYRIEDTMERPILICYTYGEAVLDDIKKEDDLIKIEGFVKANVIYITSDDAFPISSICCNIPYSQVIEFEEPISEPVYDIAINVDQISAALIGQEEVEVRAVIGVEALIMKTDEKKIITDVFQKEASATGLINFPGIIGYIAADEESLWDIAKRYKSTVDELVRINKLTDDKVQKGDKLLVLRQ